jgi:hypothetical protein
VDSVFIASLRIAERIFEWFDVRQSSVGAWRRLVDLGRTFHLQNFVRTFVVEGIDKLVETSLLLEEISPRGLSGFFLQREVHAFVTAVLLRRTWFDPLDSDPQAQPPDCQFA